MDFVLKLIGRESELFDDENKLNHFTKTISELKNNRTWTKKEIVELFFDMIPDFGHKETGKYLDGRM